MIEQDTTGLSFNERICLANQAMTGRIQIIGELGEPLKSLLSAIRTEKEEHENRAERYAAEKTGYQWDVLRILSDDHEAFSLIQDAELQRLEAAARERRLLAYAAALPAVLHYYYPSEDSDE